MAINVYGISGKTPPKASHKADFSDLVMAVSITAALTKPKNTDPTKLKNAAIPNAMSISKILKFV